MEDDEKDYYLNFDTKINESIESFYSSKKIEELYHYTSAGGIKGIIEHNCIWATHYNYLNDPNEIKYGLNLIKQVIEEDHSFIEEVKNASSMIAELLEDEETRRDTFQKDIYITSFCEKENLLGQWREYGRKGKGYCVCFKNSSDFIIGAHWEDNKDKSYILPCLSPKPVLYEYNEQKKFIQKLFKETVIEFHKDMIEIHKEGGEDLSFKVLLHYILDLCKAIIPYIKKEEFKNENEWRIIFTPDEKTETIKFREQNDYLVPYQELGFYIKNSDGVEPQNLPISKIVYGSNLDSIKTEYSLHSYLNSKKINNINIVKSEIEIGI